MNTEERARQIRAEMSQLDVSVDRCISEMHTLAEVPDLTEGQQTRWKDLEVAIEKRRGQRAANRPTGQRGLFGFAWLGSAVVNPLGARILVNT